MFVLTPHTPPFVLVCLPGTVYDTTAYTYSYTNILYYTTNKKKCISMYVKHVYSNEVPTALFVSGGATRFPYGGAK